MQGLHRTTARLLSLWALWLTPSVASAHMGFSRFDIIEGALNPVLSMYTLLPVIAAGLAIAFQPRHKPAMLALLVVAVLAGGLSHQWGVKLALANPASLGAIVILGLTAATTIRLPVPLMMIVLGITGIAAGQLNLALETQTLFQPSLFAIGVALGSGALAGYFTAVIAARRFKWFQLAGRVLGSWIAAAGLMVSVLEFYGRV